MNDKEIKKELEFLSPLLDQWQQEQMKKIPGGYFDELHQNVMAKAGGESRRKRLSQRLYKYAAVIILLAGIVWLLSHSSGGATGTNNDLITQAEALDYIEDNISDFSQEELAALIADEDPGDLQNEASSPGLPKPADSLLKEKL